MIGSKYAPISHDFTSILHHRDSASATVLIFSLCRHVIAHFATRELFPLMCPADSLVPKQLLTVKAVAYRVVTFLPLLRINPKQPVNHCECERDSSRYPVKSATSRLGDIHLGDKSSRRHPTRRQQRSTRRQQRSNRRQTH